MYSPATARPRVTLTPCRPGWHLTEGEGGTWTLTITKDARDPALTWVDILRTLDAIAHDHALRPLVLELRDAPRVCGPVVEAAGLVFALFESHGLHVAALTGHDLVQAARLHRLMTHHAPTQGRCFMDEGDCVEWARPRAPAVAPPVPGYRRVGFAAPRV